MRLKHLNPASGSSDVRDRRSRTMGGIILPISILVVAFGLFLSRPAAVADTSTIAPLAQGKSLYRMHCASCHGVNLEGQPNWRERKADGRLPAPPHDETGHTWHHPDAQLLKITKLGTEAIVGNGYKSDMPGFADILTDEEIGAVLAYIKSTWPDRIRRRHDAMNERMKQ